MHSVYRFFYLEFVQHLFPPTVGSCWVRHAHAAYPFWEWSATISYSSVFLLLFLLLPPSSGGPIYPPSIKCVLRDDKTSWMQVSAWGTAITEIVTITERRAVWLLSFPRSGFITLLDAPGSHACFSGSDSFHLNSSSFVTPLFSKTFYFMAYVHNCPRVEFP